MRLKLKKRLKIRSSISVNNPEELALINILKKYESDLRTNVKDKWLNINTNLPPNTDEMIVIYDSNTKSRTLYPAHIFLKHYLMHRFHYNWIDHVLFKYITHFMVLSDPK